MALFNPNYIHSLVDGSLNYNIAQINQLARDPAPTFSRMIILEVIPDPTLIDENKLDYWNNVVGVSNILLAKSAPRNSIIGQRIKTGIGEISRPMIVFPFFPSHLAMPCKPGEMVWTMFEDPNAKVKEIAFWFCRIAEPHFVDDVNHTHHPRQLDTTFVQGTIQKAQGLSPYYELRNGKVITQSDGVRYTQQGSETIDSDNEEIFENIVTQNDVSPMIQHESVPRFKKRPGDVAIEGSNNTLVVLGTDRKGPIAGYSDSPGLKTTIPSSDMQGFAGSIDIVAGRGMSVETGGYPVSTTRIVDGQELKKEITKVQEETSPFEGDPDLFLDRSRVLVSQRTMTDKNFSLSPALESIGVADSENGDASVVIKSDKVRIIARSDISFIVTSFVPIAAEDGRSEYKVEDVDSNNWASITIKANGDIVFTPSTSGYVKLGGDDATSAILCTELPANFSGGQVTALPIATTAGGFVGTNGGQNVDSDAVNKIKKPDLGTFSTKVLIK